MNRYPTWWNQTITVYNKFEDTQSKKITWFKTVLDNCFWKNTCDKVIMGQTAIETYNTICRIPKDDNFMEKYLWYELDEEQKAEKFTLGAGDIIVRGAVDEEIDEYDKGKRSSDFLNKYNKLQGCMLVERVSINTDGGRHNEHYYAKGV